MKRPHGPENVKRRAAVRHSLACGVPFLFVPKSASENNDTTAAADCYLLLQLLNTECAMTLLSAGTTARCLIVSSGRACFMTAPTRCACCCCCWCCDKISAAAARSVSNERLINKTIRSKHLCRAAIRGGSTIESDARHFRLSMTETTSQNA